MDQPESTPRLFGTTFLYSTRKAVGAEWWDEWIAHELAHMDRAIVPGLRTLHEASKLEPVKIMVQAQVGIPRARSKAAGLFLRSECDVWLTVDDDNFAESEVLRRLVRAARVTRGVVSGAYWLRQTTSHKLAFTTKEDNLAPYRCEELELATAPDLVFGFGLVALHREAVEAVARHADVFDDQHGTGYPALFLEYLQNRYWVGEDFAFCNRARAAGVPLALLCDAMVEHDQVGCVLGMHEGKLCTRRIDNAQR